MNLSEDKVLRFLNACEEAGINNAEQFIISKMPQVFSWMKGCFPRGILPTDIDGAVEINGHFLVLEFKHENRIRNGGIKAGQRRFLLALSRSGPFTVVVIGMNDTGDPTCCELWHYDGSHQKMRDCNREYLRRLFTRWSAHAEKKTPTTYPERPE